MVCLLQRRVDHVNGIEAYVSEMSQGACCHWTCVQSDKGFTAMSVLYTGYSAIRQIAIEDRLLPVERIRKGSSTIGAPPQVFTRESLSESAMPMLLSCAALIQAFGGYLFGHVRGVVTA